MPFLGQEHVEDLAALGRHLELFARHEFGEDHVGVFHAAKILFPSIA